MSRRTHCIRTEALNSRAFLSVFPGERWGKHLFNADDDNFVTRWLFANGWKTWVQYNQYCEIETTLENNSKFLKQCSRWARSNWRDILTRFTEGLWRWVDSFCTGIQQLTVLQTAPLVLLCFILHRVYKLCSYYWSTTFLVMLSKYCILQWMGEELVPSCVLVLVV